MKTFVLVIILALSTAAKAEEKAENQATIDNNCALLGTLAGKIMTARQNGIPFSVSFGFLDQDSMPVELKSVTRKLIINAYIEPGYHTDELKQNSITEFSNSVTVACITG